MMKRIYGRIYGILAGVLLAICGVQPVNATDSRYEELIRVYDNGDYEKAITLSDELLSGYRTDNRKLDIDGVDIMTIKASSLYRLDRPDEAVETCRIALDEGARILGRFNGMYGDLCRSMASYCYASDKYYPECVEWENMALYIDGLTGKPQDYSRLAKMCETAGELGISVAPKEWVKAMPLIYDTDSRRNWELTSDVAHYRLCADKVDGMVARGDTLSLESARALDALSEAALPLGYTEESLDAAHMSWAIKEKLFGQNSYEALDGAYRFAEALQKSGLDPIEPKSICNSIAFALDSIGRKDSELYAEVRMLSSSGYSHMGVGGNAMGDATEALEVASKVAGPDSRLYDRARFNLAQQEYRHGSRQKSLDLARQSLEWRRRKLGPGHPETVNALLSVAGFETRLGHPENALPLYREFMTLQQQNVRDNFVGMTLDEQRGYWSQYRYYYETILPSLFLEMSRAGNAGDASLAYDAALMSKNLLLNSERLMGEILAEVSPANRALIDSIGGLKQRINTQLALPESRRTEDVEMLRREVSGLQKSLMLSENDYAGYLDNLFVDWKQVRKSLRPGEAAVEFVDAGSQEQLYTYLADDATSLRSFPTAVRNRSDLMAVVLAPGMDAPLFIPLFDMNDFGEFDIADSFSARRMKEKLWDKVLAALPAGTERLYFSPAGRMHTMPVESLPGLEGAPVLCRVSSTSELTRRSDRHEESGAVLYGGLAYGKQAGYKVTVKNSGENGSDGVAEVRQLVKKIPYLPGTAEEIDNISRLLKGKVKVLKGAEGTETSFRSLGGHSPGIIHIATHGFFNSPDEVMRAMDRKERIYEGDVAMQTSGLVLSGATDKTLSSKVIGNGDDGILTAAEISGLDLGGTGLVVMSACESGLGSVASEGVFGLQRGFKKAGVKSLLMSLWRVDDKATSALMTQFYAGLESGKTPHDALESAKNYVRGREGWSDPKYWAAFILLDAID